MGLFGSIVSSLAGPLVGSIFGAAKSQKAIKKASAAQVAAMNAAIAEGRAGLEQTRQDYLPFTSAGGTAIARMGDLVGLGEPGVQASAIEALETSPLYTSLIRSGEEALLANASATGGLRGGNLQRGLADFRADTLSRVIQDQLQRLGGIAGMGSGLTTNLGALRSETAANVGNLLVGQGNARAGSILGRQQVANDLQRQITQILQSALSAGFGGPSAATVSGLRPDVRAMIGSNPGIF